MNLLTFTNNAKTIVIMKKNSILLLLLIAGSFAMNAQQKEPMRSAIFDDLPSGFTQLGNTSIYYSITERNAAGPGDIVGVSILGEINGQYYSSTYEKNGIIFGIWPKRAGAGFLSAFQVDGNPAVQVNAETGTYSNGVTCLTSLEPQGDVAARIIYTFTNDNDEAVKINAGVWGDIMIGDNDRAPLERLKNSLDDVYGIKMKHSTAANSPLLCALFGEGVTGAVPKDDYWFGFYANNYTPNQIVGNYDTDIDNYMVENSNSYDCGLGFCWKNREIGPHETLVLSWVISVGEIEYEEPFIPGDDRFEYEVEAINFDGWNDLSVEHPAHVWGYYEHPYGQNGYIEYQVDDENTWHRIPTALVSGENFDLNFNMLFNENRDTDHVLALRFNDGLDNITPMNGLSWIDVRSIEVNGLEDRIYNGQPQIYEVTIDNVEPFTIGEDGAYTLPGDYTYGIEGVFADNTIGINEVEFSILKGESEINVTIPEDCIYDAEEHAATAELVVGDGQIVITYKNTETGEVSENAPVEPGTYEVFVEVINSVNYNDLPNTSYGTFTIGLAETVISVTIPEDCVYDGEEHAATAVLLVGDGDIVITYVKKDTREATENAPVEPGTYEVFVEVINSVNYNDLPNTSYGTFTIYKIQSLIDYDQPQDVTHDGQPHGVDVQLVVGDGELTVIYENTTTHVRSTEPPTEIGTYEVFVIVTETDHYYGIDETSIGTFSITRKHTGVKELNVDGEDNGVWYTIDGRRVAAPTQPGIYIHNGVKYYVK